jgi:glutamate carboxypeptidase
MLFDSSQVARAADFVCPSAAAQTASISAAAGHCDTVWPLDTLKGMPFVIGEGIIRGPGVYDRKPGSYK